MDDSAKLRPLPPPRRTSIGVVRAAEVTSDSLPAKSDVVVVGGGICGLLTAHYLAQAGASVLVCEKGQVGCEASSRAFGWVSELLADPVKLALARRSKILWKDLQETGEELGFRQHGLAYLADTQDELDFYRGWLSQTEGQRDPDARVLDVADTAILYPTGSRTFAGALHAPSDGSIEPVLAAAGVARAARRAGVRVVQACAARGLEVAAGRIKGVHTEKGFVETGRVVCAANAWSRLFCGNHGIDVPQLYVIMSMGRTTVTSGPVGSGGQEAWAWRRQIDGAYSLGRVAGVRAPVTRDALKLRKVFEPLMKAQMASATISFGRDALADLRLARRWNPRRSSPFEKIRMLTGETDPRVAEESLRLNGEVFPEMSGAKVSEVWSGPITLTPDNTPIAGPTGGVNGLFLITGLSYGLTWGPALAQMVAAQALGNVPELDPIPFRLSRFFDGSELQITH